MGMEVRLLSFAWRIVKLNVYSYATLAGSWLDALIQYTQESVAWTDCTY